MFSARKTRAELQLTATNKILKYIYNKRQLSGKNLNNLP